MSISSLSIRRKVAVSCFIIMLFLLGLKMYQNIGIDVLPKLDIPYIQITTVYPGASPEEIEVEVAKRIEDAVASMDGLKHTTSICMENVSAITLEFELGTDVNTTLHEVREKINLIVDDFPKAVETPKLSKININAVSVVTIYVTGNRTLDELYDYVDDQLSDQFSSVPGVGEVRIHGGNEVQLHVLLDRTKLAASNLTIGEIVNAIENNNIKLPAGRIEESGQEVSITYDAEFRDVEALRQLEVSNYIGKRIYLGDLAEIKLMSKEIRQEGYFNGQPGVSIDIVKKSDANAVKVIDGIKKKFDFLNSHNRVPSGIQLHWFKDSGTFIRASVMDAWSSIFFGIVLTAFLLFLFLHELRTTFICAVTMPVSIVITFLAMRFLDYSFDMTTLLSLGCSTGVLVSNSVVVIESIYLKLHEGADPQYAAAEGTTSVVNAVCASALTNVVVFTPIVFMTSAVGMLIAPFAGVMVVATLVSLFISFTLTPILAAMLLRDKKVQHNRFGAIIFTKWDKSYDKLADGFDLSILWVSKHSGLVIIMVLVLCAGMLLLALPRVSLAFLPQYDKAEISIFLEFPSNSSLKESRRETLQILKELHTLPYVVSSGAIIGYQNATTGQITEGVHLAEISLNLKDKGDRKDIFSIQQELRAMLAKKVNITSRVIMPSPVGTSEMELTAYVKGEDFQILEKYARIGMNILRESKTGADTDVNCRAGKPRINLLPNRPILKNLGVNAQQLGYSIIGYYDGIEAGTYKIGSRTYDIRVKAEKQNGFKQGENIIAGALDGRPLNLDTVTIRESDSVSICLIREDKERSAWIYANSAPGSTMGKMVNILKEKLQPQLPTGYSLAFFGQAEMMADGASEFMDVFLIAIVLSYLLIAAIMECWVRPFLVMFTIPLGFVGMLFALYLSGTALSMVSLLGGVMMIGIVVNNAILIMDECAMLSDSGMSKHQAMITATKNKFRPIVMTSIAAIVGMLPMAFGTGLGSEVRASCGIGVVGGLCFASILTLYLIPAMYFKFTKDKIKTQDHVSLPEK
ncbi:MAG: efflux RND transporter permease subunit [Candidatus Paceibacterota bacterium]